ncbi:MAG: hypothetical protein CMP12_21860 [Zunongwangia sp.]|jgi:hypothetical protein|uniref:Uncharacterized protein n=2 Tax=Zunongwangia profunda TaxID=398743 RepID=D5BHN0_ZUNPS|nr:hypothetical protein [Zunongwangia profunda]MAC64941.1 hypothetical protein [Flavobacteriaceae bacterium]MAO38508.1 hypothetical protein [Zunongwangia sp.]ADF53428.1 conserved hypothetical protein [Zunongwangia profunda SM-A87]MAG86902.1 hypothetical protein [Flavobacteriaceae bacterium]MAS71828.1 hypothetical protein [Zunongwangia sp.]|tara:strand:+ start:239 stop:1303 length:1065 start_codon:yes stop_codon:yes gene_type:complete
MEPKLMSKKKPSFPVNERFNKYLARYNRNTKIPVFYEDLLRFSGSVVVYDQDDEDTYWVRCYYPEFERQEIDESLKKIYNILHSDGSDDMLEFLAVDAIDYCTFGNSKPFRIKVRNILNDVFTYFYVKKADASRIYGLELEHLLSPHRITFLVYKDTLIEAHIAGIPGDVFIEDHLPRLSEWEKAQIAKQFVKFNERCTVRLLGDMRSYNYVVIPTHDFDHVQYQIRAIDFDQQCFEGKFKVYRPQFFKENYKMVKLVSERLQLSSIEQYRKEERSLLAKRMINTQARFKRLIKCMSNDHVSTRENVNQLRTELYHFTKDVKFKRASTMGQILRTALDFVQRNYEDVNMKRLLQ